MSDLYFSTVAKADRIRVRPENENSFLLYNPRTDQLHLVSEQGKRIFDLCDGRSIDSVVGEACETSGEGEAPPAPDEVLGFLCALKKRDLVVMD